MRKVTSHLLPPASPPSTPGSPRSPRSPWLLSGQISVLCSIVTQYHHHQFLLVAVPCCANMLYKSISDGQGGREGGRGAAVPHTGVVM